MKHDRLIRQMGCYDRNAVSEETGVDCSDDECIVQQSFQDECDVNVIVSRFGVVDAPRRPQAGIYGDFTGIYDYESAVRKIDRARRGFMDLPAAVRERYNNDVGRFAREAGSLSQEELERMVRDGSVSGSSGAGLEAGGGQPGGAGPPTAPGGTEGLGGPSKQAGAVSGGSDSAAGK